MALSNPYPFTDGIGLPASDLNAAVVAATAGTLSGHAWGTGVATFLQTPSSANLASAVTGETGSGALVFATSPTLVTPVIGAATGTSLALSGQLRVGGAAAFPGTVTVVSIPAAAVAAFNGAGGKIGGNLYYDAGWKYAANGTGAMLDTSVTSTIAMDIYSAANNAGGAAAAATLIRAATIYANGDLRQGSGSALATTATDGFFLIATCAGAPTGVPTNAGAGQIPLIFDKTNFQLYAYISGTGWKKSAVWT